MSSSPIVEPNLCGIVYHRKKLITAESHFIVGNSSPQDRASSYGTHYRRDRASS
ncbi:MAG: hypothetical protein GY754_17525 [bacterium]|nr:hypothetical protein [bacterium]